MSWREFTQILHYVISLCVLVVLAVGAMTIAFLLVIIGLGLIIDGLGLER